MRKCAGAARRCRSATCFLEILQSVIKKGGMGMDGGSARARSMPRFVGVMLDLELSSNDNACLKRGRIVTSQDSGGSWAAPPSLPPFLLSGALKGERRGKGVGLDGRAPSRGSCVAHDRWLQSSLGDVSWVVCFSNRVSAQRVL